ncbi:Abortive infection protein [Segniliparus rotundus DSM 44985]|uniref:Abortive infection protein n=1 Tax=Segniliparus rotundus (strain ATCC BAA-972 / CDC 1076 / CIP 108378 / DSM 44985 / JCM 13578) TaxID=640132 RepID=D6ZBB8_SEGRD|nr:CPBP family intramembrane glutamic endopeptidase [Segniliparus rotundus]ADG98870.1 Abortive infection protein [Segniliparus rotundus DSM 44985]
MSQAPARDRGRWSPTPPQAAVLAALAAGTPVVRRALTRRPGSRAFTTWAAMVAAVWFASGEAADRAAGGVSRERWNPRGSGRGAVFGAALGGLFVIVAPIVRRFPVLARWVDAVLAHRSRATGPGVVILALVAGAAEERFFRGPVYDQAGGGRGRKTLASTVLYTAATAGTGNPALVAAAAALGLAAAAERGRTRSVFPSMALHAAWTTTMYYAFPSS